MKTVTNFEWHGKKAKPGGLYWAESDRMHIFITYCMECRGKVVFTRQEAEEFAKLYYRERNKIRTRLLNKMMI